ncbi:MAG: hypothetical protein ACJ71T_01185 [Actinomycetales bacterium]
MADPGTAPTVSVPATAVGDPGLLLVDVSSDSALTDVVATLVPEHLSPATPQTATLHLVSGDATSGTWESDRVDLGAYDDFTYSVTATDTDGDTTTSAPTTLTYWPAPQPHDLSITPDAVDYTHQQITATGQLDRIDPRTGSTSAWAGQAVRLTAQAYGIDVTTDNAGVFTASYVPQQTIVDGAIPVTLSARVNNGSVVKVESFGSASVPAAVAPSRLFVDTIPTLDAGANFTVTGHAEVQVNGAWQPLPGVSVYIMVLQGRTDEQGAFSVTQRVPGSSITADEELDAGPLVAPASQSVPLHIRPYVELPWRNFSVSLTSTVHIDSYLYSEADVDYLPGRTVLLEQSINGTTGWTTAATLATDSTGHLLTNVTVAHPHYYFRLHYLGDTDYQPNITAVMAGTRTDTAIVSLNGSPEPTVKGRTITVTGVAERQPGNAAWVGLPHQSIRYYFRASGSTTYHYMGSSTSDASGRFSRAFTAVSSGYWSARWITTSASYVDATSGQDYVAVRRYHSRRAGISSPSNAAPSYPFRAWCSAYSYSSRSAAARPEGRFQVANSRLPAAACARSRRLRTSR